MSWSVTFQVSDANTGYAIEYATVSEVSGPGPPFAGANTDITGNCVLEFIDVTPNSPAWVTVECSCVGYGSTSTSFLASEYAGHSGGPPVQMVLSPVVVPDGSKSAVGDPAAYMFDDESTQHIAFRGSDSHLYEFWWSAASGWLPTKLTRAAAGAPNAVGDPVGYLFAAQNTQHVIYRAADHHIHELWKDASGWHHHDPTGDNGAPDAVSDPAGYVFAAQNTQHIIYRGKDDHLVELWWVEGNWSHKDVTVEASQTP